MKTEGDFKQGIAELNQSNDSNSISNDAHAVAITLAQVGVVLCGIHHELKRFNDAAIVKTAEGNHYVFIDTEN